MSNTLTKAQRLEGLKSARRAAWVQVAKGLDNMNKLASTVSFMTGMQQGEFDDPFGALTLALAGIARRANDAMKQYLQTEDSIEELEHEIGQKLAREVVKQDRALPRKPTSRKAVR